VLHWSANIRQYKMHSVIVIW